MVAVAVGVCVLYVPSNQVHSTPPHPRHAAQPTSKHQPRHHAIAASTSGAGQTQLPCCKYWVPAQRCPGCFCCQFPLGIACLCPPAKHKIKIKKGHDSQAFCNTVLGPAAPSPIAIGNACAGGPIKRSGKQKEMLRTGCSCAACNKCLASLMARGADFLRRPQQLHNLVLPTTSYFVIAGALA
ncbi:hypothetical protein J3E74DRAFT_295324 [Bipolaris maydis]|nr:hypothetical protein J3E74DRAFT_295324 [Bipolaris maydis]